MSRLLTKEELDRIYNAIPATPQGEELKKDLAKRLEGRYFQVTAIPQIIGQAEEIAHSSQSLEPRPLTPAEIDRIIAALPKVRSANKEVGSVATKEIRDKVRQQLQRIEITPLGIPELTQALVNKFEGSRIAPGSTIGTTAAEAFGAQITQMTLNTFHSAGSAKNVSAGVSRVRELIRATPNPKYRSCSVFFTRRDLSLEDIIADLRPDIVGLKIADLILDYDIDQKSSLMEEEPFWYGLYRSLIRNDFGQEDQFILRLSLNVDLMYAYKIAPVDIAARIEERGGVIVVYSPLNLGIIDIYALEEVANRSEEALDPRQAEILFLQLTVLPEIGPIRLTGVEGITGLFPVSLPTMSIVSSEIDLHDGKWLLKYNRARLLSSGIGTDTLKRLVTQAGLKVVPSKDYQGIGLVVESIEPPIALINRRVADDDKETNEWEEAERKKGIRFPYRPPTPLGRAAKFYYADTVGSNYKVLLGRDDVDTRYTVSNDVHEIVSTLGIEAARNFLLLELLRVITAEGSYINPRHVSMVVEFMTNQGRVLPITYFGIQRQPIGALALASFERSMNVFKSAASYNKVEPIQSTSTSIYVGQRAPIGTGAIDVLTDKEMVATRQKELEASRPSPEELTQAIEQLEDVMIGGSIVADESIDLNEMFSRASPAIFSPTKEVPSTKIITVGKPAPIQPSPVPVVSNQLVQVQRTVDQTGLPCLPQVEEVMTRRDLPSTSTAELRNRNLRPIPTLQALPTQGIIQPVTPSKSPQRASRRPSSFQQSRSILPRK